MTQQIIDAYLGLNALRQAGYKSTATAIAELVDNSIEANADKISIITISRAEQTGKRVMSQVKTLAVLDNGDGMPVDVLSKCLSMGWGTRLGTRDGLGRFGFGLKGASISQAKKIEVYSWTKGEKVYRVELDLDEVKNNNQQVLGEPCCCDLPAEIVSSMGDLVEDKGTLVVWTKIDQIDFKRADTLIRRIDKDLCRIYRHFLDDDDTYVVKRDISVIHVDGDTNKIIGERISLRANDPLYRITLNNVPGYSDKKTNEVYEIFEETVMYEGPEGLKEHKIKFTCTIAKPEIQGLTGNSDLGKHYANNTGISFVRAGREIDIRGYGYIERSEPRHRWWGIEVRFTPELDELFGITNNKQSVRNIRKLDDDQIDAYNDVEGDNSKEAILLRIDFLLAEKIKGMMDIITWRKKGTKKVKTNQPGLPDKINEDIDRSDVPTISDTENKNKTYEQRLDERIKLISDDDSSLSKEEVLRIATKGLKYKIDLTTDSWPGKLFLDRRSVGDGSVGIVNRKTEFYAQFWDYLENQADQKGFEALEILLMALIRSEDELCTKYKPEVFADLRDRWGYWVEELIPHAGS